MKRLLAFAALPLLWATPAGAAGWNCSVREELSPNLPAMLETLVAADGSRTTLDFYIYWVPQRGYAAGQVMSWIAIPREGTALWKPDRIEFGIPGLRTDQRGHLRFDAPQFPIVPARGIARSLRPQFDQTWVTLQDANLIAQLWRALPRRAELFDRRSRSIGGVDILLPDAGQAQGLFTRMRAELERRIVDPAANCRALPDALPEEI